VDVAAERGGRVVPMFNPQNLQIQHDFEPGYVFRALPGWGWLFELDPPARLAALRDPAQRRRLEEAAAAPTAGLAVVVRNWATYRVNEVPRPELAPLVGRSIADKHSLRSVFTEKADRSAAVVGNAQFSAVTPLGIIHTEGCYPARGNLKRRSLSAIAIDHHELLGFDFVRMFCGHRDTRHEPGGNSAADKAAGHH
jgi:hypothetical protein